MKFKLVESLLEDLDSNYRSLQKKFDQNTVDFLVELDPSIKKDEEGKLSGEGKFLPWIGRMYSKNEITLQVRVFNKAKEAIEYFYKNIKQFENKDINQFKTLNDLVDQVEKIKSSEKSTYEIKIDNLEKNMSADNLPYPDFDIKKAKEGINLVYHDSKWLVYVPENYEASVVLRGQNAKWCTGWHENNQRMDYKYNEYTEDGSKLYIIINKQNSNEKYQVCIHPDDSWQEFNDAKNNSLNRDRLKDFFDKNLGLCNFFGKLTNYDLCVSEEIKEKEYIYDGIHPVPAWVKKVRVKDGMTEIGNYTFYDNNSLKEITIPDSITRIGVSAFVGCKSLEKINLPESITTIGNYAFSDCTSLLEITIPESVVEIGEAAFCDCTILTKVIIKGNNLTKIRKYAFSGCTSLLEITIPESTTRIERCAFLDCTSLLEITIPESITRIEKEIFDECSPNLIVKTNNEYVQEYCEANNIKWERLNNEI